MSRKIVRTGFIAGIILLSCSQTPVKEDQVVARVDSEVLLLEDLQERIPEDSRYKMTIDQIRKYVDHWVNTQLVYQQAYRIGLHNTLADELQQELKRFETEYLANKLVEREINRKIKISPEEVEEYYTKNREQFIRGNKELRLVHLVTTYSETADAISAELLQHKNLEDLVKKYQEKDSLWPNGDLGYLPENVLPTEIVKNLARLKIGETTRMIKTDFGFHFFKIVDIQPQGSSKSLEEVQDQISEILKVDKRNEAYLAYLVRLKTRAEEQHTIKVNYEALKVFQQDTTNILAK